ncbi:Gtr1/RagA G protein Gtr2 [Mycena floridula]|nr:Gtr1/RagA G protein Gtr2 [Mycena floridula]
MSSKSTAASTTAPTNGTRQNSSVARTKILMLGMRKSGKTSIRQVLFNDLSPKQAFYVEPTMRIVKQAYDTVIPLEIWDCPGNMTFDSLDEPLANFSTLIFVIDIRDLYNQPISKLVEFIVPACHDNPNINIEVFVHKAEKLQEDDKIENFRQIHERVADRLLDISPEYAQIPLNFHLTSVHDHSLHEAFSRVLHKLIDSLPYIEELLNVFCANSQSPKAFLFDATSRLYVATDASPVDSATHNLCCDYLQTLTSFGPLYKSMSASPARLRQPLPATPPPSASSTISLSVEWDQSSSPTTPTSYQPPPSNSRKPPKELFYPSAATSLHPGTTLTYHLITPQLALLALLPTSVFESRRGLIEFNVVFFREGVQEICDVEHEARVV